MESSHIRVVRVGDNMRDVAVTEGDKVEAEIKFGWEVDAYNITDVAEYVDAVSAVQAEALVEEYYASYNILLEGRDEKEFRRHVKEQAAIELGFRKFLEEHNYHAVVTSFQMLSGLKQLPGLAMQRLMADGYGFGAEGDWKTAAMVRLMKIMAEGMPKGTSFMEDYTYHLEAGKEAILQAHMLEVCPTIADVKPSIKVCPLSMGNREDPARLVFTTKPGNGVACSLVDLGTRFRLIVNDVTSLKQDIPMPKLPVATALWKPQPNLITGAEAWILAGGAHHTAFSLDLTSDQIADWGEAMGIEVLRINKDTIIPAFKNEIRWNHAYYR
jgi:L-arabinose isomerase